MGGQHNESKLVAHTMESMKTVARDSSMLPKPQDSLVALATPKLTNSRVCNMKKSTFSKCFNEHFYAL